MTSTFSNQALSEPVSAQMNNNYCISHNVYVFSQKTQQIVINTIYTRSMRNLPVAK